MSRRLRLSLGIALAAAGAGACDWPWTNDMVRQPSQSPHAGPVSAVEGTLTTTGEVPRDRAEASEPLRNPLPSYAPIDTGRALYRIHCSPCHGITGTGDGRVAREFPRPADLTSTDVQQHDDGWIYMTIRNGGHRMPRYGHELTPLERWEIVRFVRSFRVERP